MIGQKFEKQWIFIKVWKICEKECISWSFEKICYISWCNRNLKIKWVFEEMSVIL